MGRITSYHPLQMYPRGPWSEQPAHARPLPFEDCSCRREPDFCHAFPAITGLCRLSKTRKFEVGERVAYFTVGTHRLAAILHIQERFDTHIDAVDRWYRPRGLEPPGNLLVAANQPLPYGKTCGFYTNPERERIEVDSERGRTPEALVREWDALYRNRQEIAPHAIVCARLFHNLSNPPAVSGEAAARIFPSGRFPGTRNPAKVDEGVIDRLVAELGIQLDVPTIPPESQ